MIAIIMMIDDRFWMMTIIDRNNSGIVCQNHLKFGVLRSRSPVRFPAERANWDAKDDNRLVYKKSTLAPTCLASCILVKLNSFGRAIVGLVIEPAGAPQHLMMAQGSWVPQ